MTTLHTDPEAIKPLLRDLGQGPTRGRSLTRDEARQCLDLILDGRATPAQAGAFLILQRYKGETPDELLGFVDAVRGRPSTHTIAPKAEGLLDVGSPYDGRLRNILVTPAASIVAAACGSPQLLHGEPEIAPKHGVTVADVLHELGVATDLPPAAVSHAIESNGIGYLRQVHFAPDLASIKWLRDEIALRSPLNMVEKIYDPASAPYHLVGLTHLPYLDKLGGALAGLGFTKTARVQGMEGNEDLPTSRAARIIEFTGDGAGGAEQREYRINAADYGLTPASNEDVEISGEERPTPERSARLTTSVLQNEAPPAWRDLVVFNAAFRLQLAGRVDNVEQGIEMAQKALDEGLARDVLERWRSMR